jgi:hypothetical protein
LYFGGIKWRGEINATFFVHTRKYFPKLALIIASLKKKLSLNLENNKEPIVFQIKNIKAIT